MKRLLAAVIVAGLLCSGCGSLFSNTWYKAGASQADMNKDAQECDQVAQLASKEQTLRGKGLNVEIYIKAYNNCLFGKGWSLTGPQKASSQISGPAKAVFSSCTGTKLAGFDQTMTLPDGFVLQKSDVWAAGATLNESYFFQRADNSFVSIIFQRSPEIAFEGADYPVTPPFETYSKIQSADKGGKLRYATYFGQYMGAWVCGFGVYFLLDSDQRIIFVATRLMPGPEGDIPAGLKLARNQRQDLEAFETGWRTWLEKTFAASVKFEDGQ